MKQITAKYHFTEEYRDNNYTRQEVMVILEIDYRSKTYSIIPYSSCNASFDFRDPSHNWNEWKATLKAIDAAIDFGNLEVGNVPRVVQGTKGLRSE